MVMDRIAASKVYKGKDYNDGCAWEYYCRASNVIVIHPDTKKLLEKLLLMLKEKGERYTFTYIRRLLKYGKY